MRERHVPDPSTVAVHDHLTPFPSTPPRPQFEVSRVDEYIANTLYGVKPDVAKAPLRSLQGRAEDGPQFEDQIRMTMY